MDVPNNISNPNPWMAYSKYLSETPIVHVPDFKGPLLEMAIKVIW